MDNLNAGLNLTSTRTTKSVSTASLKDHLKISNIASLVAKYDKIRKIVP
jgi:hypothetical protein